MMKQNNHIEWTDVLFIPVAMFLSYGLGQWMPIAFAIAVSFVLVTLGFSLFSHREGSFKRFLLEILLGAIICYALAALFGWPP